MLDEDGDEGGRLADELLREGEEGVVGVVARGLDGVEESPLELVGRTVNRNKHTWLFTLSSIFPAYTINSNMRLKSYQLAVEVGLASEPAGPWSIEKLQCWRGVHLNAA